MFGIHDYGLFILTGVLLNLTPGQDTLFILGRSLAGGLRVGVASALGITAGSVIHTVAATLGLSAILATSDAAFTVVKLAGAAYLVWLGVGMLAGGRDSAGLMATQHATGDAMAAFRQGMLTNVLNPKVALFFLALLPQFIDPGSDTKALAFLALGATFIVTGTLWCLVLAFAAARLSALFQRRPEIQRLAERAAGVLFIALGLRLAWAR